MDDFYDFTGTSSYWELNDGEPLSGEVLRGALYNRNFYFRKTTKVASLRELYVRAQRGLPFYEGVTLKELRHLAAERGLTPQSTMMDIKTQLERADNENNNAFHRFLDLPPEICERIYTQYFNT